MTTPRDPLQDLLNFVGEPTPAPTTPAQQPAAAPQTVQPDAMGQLMDFVQSPQQPAPPAVAVAEPSQSGLVVPGKGDLFDAIINQGQVLPGQSLGDIGRNLETVDRYAIRPFRQPIAELINPDSWRDVDWTPRFGADAFGPAPNRRGRMLQEQYDQFQVQQGRAPGYMNRLDIQQASTPWWMELAAEAPLAFTPLGGSLRGGVNILNRGSQAAIRSAERGWSPAGHFAQRTLGSGLEGISRVVEPYAVVEDAIGQGLRALGRGITAGGRRLFTPGTPPAPTQVAPQPAAALPEPQAPTQAAPTPPEAAAPAPATVPEAGPESGPMNLQVFKPKDLQTDASLFQFKRQTDASGVSTKLQDVTEWDPELGGLTFVWQRKDGQYFVVDGHQRVGLAKRLEAEGQQPEILARVWREEDGYTPQALRLMAAKKNIGEGSGTAIDASRVLSEDPDLFRTLSPSGALVRDARSFAKLSPEVFEEVTEYVSNGRLPENVAAIVPKVGDNPAMQRMVLREFAREHAESNLTPSMAENLLYTIRRNFIDSNPEGFQGAMFDTGEIRESAWRERDVLQRGLHRAFVNDRRLFGAVTRGETRISEVGNILDEAANVQELDTAKTSMTIFDNLANKVGPLADYLDSMAARIKRDMTERGVSRNVAATQVVREASLFLREMLPGYLQDSGESMHRKLIDPGPYRCWRRSRLGGSRLGVPIDRRRRSHGCHAVRWLGPGQSWGGICYRPTFGNADGFWTGDHGSVGGPRRIGGQASETGIFGRRPTGYVWRNPGDCRSRGQCRRRIDRRL